MKVGILGSGVVGQQLGMGFVNLGYSVKIGTRDPKKLAPWIAKTNGEGSAGRFEEAAMFGELLVLATLWTATENILQMAGAQNTSGKVVIDATNPLNFSGGVPPKLLSRPDHSGGEQVQKWLPEAKVVKAFNTVGSAIMCNAPRREGVPDLFICGNHEGAKKKVADLASQWGWDSTIDVGDITQSYLLEALAMWWMSYGFRNHQWTHALKLLRE